METWPKNGLSKFELRHSFMLSQSFFSSPPLSQQKLINSLNTKVAIRWKPVNSFARQIN